jgi:hypothetical protein
MLDLLVASDLIRRETQASLAPIAPRDDRRKVVPKRRDRVRSTSAAALRGLADRLEPSPTL